MFAFACAVCRRSNDAIGDSQQEERLVGASSWALALPPLDFRGTATSAQRPSGCEPVTASVPTPKLCRRRARLGACLVGPFEHTDFVNSFRGEFASIKAALAKRRRAELREFVQHEDATKTGALGAKRKAPRTSNDMRPMTLPPSSGSVDDFPPRGYGLIILAILASRQRTTDPHLRRRTSA